MAIAWQPGQVFTRDVLLEQVWRWGHPAGIGLVNVHVQPLRIKGDKAAENPRVVPIVRVVRYQAGSR